MCDVRVVRVPEVKPVLPFIGRIYSINLLGHFFFVCTMILCQLLA